MNEIDIQNIKLMPEIIHIGDGKEDKDIKDSTAMKINELIKAIQYLDNKIKEK